MFKKLGNMKFSGRKVLAIAILAAADVFVIAAPYYLRLIVPNIHSIMGISSSQFASLISIIGGVTLATQLPGGWLADKFSSKKLLFMAVLSTGVLTMAGGMLIQLNDQITSNLFMYYVIIYVGGGISSTLIFGAPLWKLVSQQAENENQGEVYGLQGSINGIIGLTIVFVAGYIAQILVEQGTTIAFPIYVYGLSAGLIATSILIIFYVPEHETKEKFAIDFKNMGKVMKTFRVGLCSLFVMGMYMFQSVFAFYMLQLLTNSLHVLPVALIAIGGIRTYALRFAVSGGVGRFADKMRSHVEVLSGALGIGCILALVFILSPGFTENGGYLTSPAFQSYMVIMYLFAGFLSGIMVTLRYAQINELPKPDNSYASVTALISLIAFSPDAWFYSISAEIEKNFQVLVDGKTQTSLEGYQIILTIAVSVAFLGVLCGILLFQINKRELKKLNKTNYRGRELSNR